MYKEAKLPFTCKIQSATHMLMSSIELYMEMANVIIFGWIFIYILSLVTEDDVTGILQASEVVLKQ